MWQFQGVKGWITYQNHPTSCTWGRLLPLYYFISMEKTEHSTSKHTNCLADGRAVWVCRIVPGWWGLRGNFALHSSTHYIPPGRHCSVAYPLQRDPFPSRELFGQDTFQRAACLNWEEFNKTCSKNQGLQYFQRPYKTHGQKPTYTVTVAVNLGAIAKYVSE